MVGLCEPWLPLHASYNFFFLIYKEKLIQELLIYTKHYPTFHHQVLEKLHNLSYMLH